MANQNSPDNLYSRIRNVTVVTAGCAGSLMLLVFESAPPESRIGLVFAIVALFLFVSLGGLMYIYRGGTVFGDAGAYPLGVAALVAAGLFGLTTIEITSQALALAALAGVGAVVVTSVLTIRAAH